MQSSSEGCYNIVELAKQLRREYLFINSERETLQNLNERVENTSLELSQAAWICAQQRLNLNNLIVSRAESNSITLCQRANHLENTTFIDAHKVLKYKDVLSLGELLRWVRETPRLVALCLLLGEGGRGADSIAHSLCAGLYGGCVHPEDRSLVLRVLRHLLKHQVAADEDPRKLLRAGSCAFSRLYAVFRDAHAPAALFLSAALRAPLLQLLKEDEFFFDIDPDKALERFNTSDRLKKFGQPNTTEYNTKLARYRKWSVAALSSLASNFIASLTSHWSCFPPSLGALVRRLAARLASAGVTEREIHMTCTDLVFTHFVCPAIVNPEAYGIIDIPVSYVARYNLIQVAQIIQMLCLAKYQPPETKVRDLYGRFNKECVSSLLETIILDPDYSTCEPDLPTLDEDGGLRTEPSVGTYVAMFTRAELRMLISYLQRISSYLNNNTPPNPAERPNSEEGGPSNAFPPGPIFDGSSNDTTDPARPSNHQPATSNSAASHSNGLIDHDGCSTPINQQNGDLDSTRSNYSDGRPNGDVFPIDGKSNETFSSSGSDEGSSTSSNSDSSRFNGNDAVGVGALVQSLEPNFRSRLHDLLKRLPDLTDIRRASSTASESHSSHSSPSHEPSTSRRLLAKVPKPRIPRSGSMASALASFTGDSVMGSSRDEARSAANGDGAKDRKKLEVLMIKLPGDNGPEYVGLLPESKVLEQYYSNLEGSVETAPVDILLPGDQEIVVDVVPDISDVGHTKRTRFSVKCPSSHDEVSIGNTSDGLEAVSEAASNHSVTSSLELETEDQNDNLSDMVSANVSGRGSPNISGRDTPSSQVTEGEVGLHGDVGLPPPPPARSAASVYQQQSAAIKQAKLLKQARNEIVDKFCKFEIKKLLEGDETISIYSDTWSTDVLASDSETIGDAYERNYLLPSVQGMNAATMNAGAGLVAPLQPDVSETASESAWSIDVLASDSDRMTEVDTDDCVSVAARSDTSSLARGPSRRQSAASGDSTPALRPIAVCPPVPPTHQPEASSGVRRGAEFVVTSPRTSAHARHMPPMVPASNSSPIQPSGSSSTQAQNGVGEVYQQFQPVTVQNLDERKSILVNGYPVMMCYGPLAPDSPQSPERGRPPLPPGLFDFPQPSMQAPLDPSPARTIDTVPSSPSSADGPIRNGYSTNQWVNNAHNRFPPPSSDSSHSTFRPIKNEHDEFDDVSSTNRDTDTMDRSLNSSESSFNASSSSHCDHNPTFEPVPGPSGSNGDAHRSAISDLMTRMSSATISSSANLVNNIASRLVKTSEIRTSIISISSSRVEKAQNGKRSKDVENLTDMSLSTLSVNSVDTASTSERSSSQDVVSENVITARRVSPPSLDEVRNGIARSSSDKPGPSTGAIPKSISFDSTAEKIQRHGPSDVSEGETRGPGGARRAGANLFNKIKMFRHRSGRGSHGPASHEKRLENQDIVEGRAVGCSDVLDEAIAGRSDDVPKLAETNESTDDILAKYRRKASAGSADSRNSRSSTRRLSEDPDRSAADAALLAEGSVELNNAEVFASVKHKLRHVLANADLHCMDYAPSQKTCTELTSYLRLVSACESEASAVHAAEALRCVRACGEAGARRLLASIRADSAARRPYTAYLARSRRGLLTTLARLDRQVSRVRGESSRSARAAAGARCLQQLERGAALRRLARQFATHAGHSLSGTGEGEHVAPVDERAARLAAGMRVISAEIKACVSWENASQAQLDAVDAAVERAAFARIYVHAMFPNGEGDIARDHVLCEHMRRLSSCVSAASVGVAPRHVPAAPFPAAQAHLAALPVYRAPRDKVRCVVGCVTSIMAVLSMSEGGAASADDLTPVLVYVIIKVNPPSLLSTIQFVQNFHPGALQGEEHYWWTQFCSAVSYIKTMEYRRPNP